MKKGRGRKTGKESVCLSQMSAQTWNPSPWAAEAAGSAIWVVLGYIARWRSDWVHETLSHKSKQ